MPKRKQFDAPTEAAIVRAYETGTTCQKIAQAHAVDFAIIKRVLVNSGVYEHGRRFAGRYSEEQKADMEARYLDGESLTALGKRFGCDPLNVRHILKRRDVALRAGRTYPLSARNEQLLRRRREDGLTFAAIAREMDVPPHRALKWARELGISDFVGKSGPDSPSWRGGTTVHHGYRHIRLAPDDPLYPMARGNHYVPEHRVVMARSLGRVLTPSESVHHINGDRLDNRLENLQLRMGQHGKGVVMTCLDCGSHNVTADALA